MIIITFFLVATWYAIAGIVLGCMAFVVGMTVVAYKCYRRYGQRSGNEGQNRLSSAIKKGRRLTCILQSSLIKSYAIK